MEQTEKEKPNLWYNWNTILSKNRLFNFVVGIRGGGKTYGATKFAINAWLKKGKKSIWMRRQATEMNNIFCRGFFQEQARKEFLDYQFKVLQSPVDGISNGYIKKKGDKEWTQFMLFMPLSIALKQKSTYLGEYDYIWYDEFLIDIQNTNLRYLSGWNEPRIFLEYYESVARTRPNVRAIFIGNAIASVNPYFTAFNIKFDKNNEWLLTDYVCVHNYTNKKFRDMKTKSAWGQFLETTEYGKYNLDNEFINESDAFIEKPSTRAIPMFNIDYMNKIYTILSDIRSGKVYVSDHIVPDIQTYCFTTDDMKPNLMMIDRVKSNPGGLVSYMLKKSFKGGYLYYNSMETKVRFYEFVNLLV